MLFTKTASYRFFAAAGTAVGRDSLLIAWVLARVLVLVREVVVALLKIDERSEADVDARDARDERDVKRGCTCDIDGGGGGGTRRVVVVVVVDDDDDKEIDREASCGDGGTDRGRGVGPATGEGDLDEGLRGSFGGLSCLALFIASPQLNARADAVVGLTAQADETFSNDSSKLLVSPLSPL